MIEPSPGVTHTVDMASTPGVHRVLELAATLSREEREELAAELLAELEPDDELDASEWERAWGDELEKRAALGLAPIPWADVRAEIDERLAKIRAERSNR